MRLEVVLACFILCLAEAGSSHLRRHLTTALFKDPVRLDLTPQSSFAKAGTDTASLWGDRNAVRDIDQSASPFLHKLTSGIQVPARDLWSLFGHKHRNRSHFLQKVLRQATNQFRDNLLTSSTTNRQMTSQMEKRRSRYKCDFTRVTIQMILEYFRTRRICGYRVSRMRFGLGGK